MTRTPEFESWINKARDADILQEALSRGARLKRSGHEWIGPCPACGGVDRLGVNPAKGVFICRGFGGGGVIRLVEHIEGLPFLAAVEAITGDPRPGRGPTKLSDEALARIKQARLRADEQREARKREQAAAERKNRGRAGDIWRSAVPIDGTLAEIYLHHRGIPTPREGWPDCFRFHPRVSYPDRDGQYPALICRADNEQGVPVAIWRIYLARDGKGKANAPKSKLGLGGVAGAAVRIGCEGPHIGICEGVETALGAWYLTGRAFPVWAALSTSGVVGFQVPESVSKVTIFADGDKPIRRKGDEYVPSEPAGRAAARKLHERLMNEGIECVIASEPPAGADYLDLWVAAQRSAA